MWKNWSHVFECLENENTRQYSTYIGQLEASKEKLLEVKSMSKTREALMVNEFIFKPSKETIKPTQRRSLFRNMCKEKGNCFKY